MIWCLLLIPLPLLLFQFYCKNVPHKKHNAGTTMYPAIVQRISITSELSIIGSNFVPNQPGVKDCAPIAHQYLGQYDFIYSVVPNIDFFIPFHSGRGWHIR